MGPQDAESSNACVDVTHVERRFIKLYKHLTHLWNPQHPDYNNRFKRNISYDILLKVYRRIMPKATRSHVRQKINILRSCYRKEMRKCLASRTVMPDGKVVNTYIPASWKFHAMKFLDCEESENEGDIVLESPSNAENYEEEDVEYNIQDTELDSTDDPESSKMHLSPIYIEDKPLNHWMDDSLNNTTILEREFNAIGANVSCKLQRMNPQQRYHAELLINKVLISGLKEKLTEETDLTDVWRLHDDISQHSEKEDSIDDKSNIIEIQ